jgi:hypothetical protein
MAGQSTNRSKIVGLRSLAFSHWGHEITDGLNPGIAAMLAFGRPKPATGLPFGYALAQNMGW